MSRKLGKSTFPPNHGPNDFKCFGPPAVEDGNFDGVNICDLGCFTQDGKNSNKMYHAAVVQSNITSDWYCYLEWGRVGAKKPQFQFIECSSQTEAQREMASVCHSKNDKRGMWTEIAGIRTLTAKPGKDVYLVRPLATRSTGLPDAKTIKYNDGGSGGGDGESNDGESNSPDKPTKRTKKRKSVNIDRQTQSLLNDLVGATISYTRGQMADNSLPTQQAIDYGRAFLTEAKRRLLVVGNNVDDQVADRDLVQLTEQIYRRIGKAIPVRGVRPEDWILSQDNILSWEQDLDAFESALQSEDWENYHQVEDPYHGMPLTMEWINPETNMGKFLYYWWPRATANRHGYLGDMRIKNLWKVDRRGDEEKIQEYINQVNDSSSASEHRPLFQPSERPDLDREQYDLWQATNTNLLFHGTRSVNVSGILRESLRLPKQLVGVPITGAMFGSGLYWADDWKKSAGYTSLRNSYWSRGSGGIARRGSFMFAAEVCLGKSYLAPKSGGYTCPPQGHHSIFGAGSVYSEHTGNRNYHSGVANNEWITFDTSSVRLKYLAEFEV